MTGRQWINGQWQIGQGECFTANSPWDGSVVWQGQSASDTQVHDAVEAARKAFKSWSYLSVSQRYDYLARYNQILEAEKDTLAMHIATGVGKPLWEAKTEVSAMIAKLDISLKAYEARTPERILSQGAFNAVTRHKPHGVMAVFGPFNLPAHLPNGHWIPALLAGNTIVFKPSEYTPMVGEYMMELWARADLPPGVLNCVQGGVSVGKALLSAPIQGILFTGSHKTGLSIQKAFAERLDMMIALELGGNNPLVAWDVDNIDAAAYLTLLSTFITSGQRCTCARRLIIEDNAQGDALLHRLIAMTKNIKLGKKPTDEAFMGPVIHKNSAQVLLQGWAEMKKQGAKVHLDMAASGHELGAFLSPGILEPKVFEDTEYFGPCLQVYRATSLSEAVNMANQTRYGLSSGLLTDNMDNFEPFYHDIKAGLVNLNRQLTGASSQAPFGGIGNSGNHRPSAFYAADYCAYPVAGLESEALTMPTTLLPGLC